jgi:peptide/nickel transport system substrate-binding protein
VTRHNNKGRRFRVAVATLAVLALGLSACGGSDDPEGEQAEGLDALRVVSAIVPSSLDADSTNINDIYTNYQVAAQYMSTLVRIRPTDGDEPLTFEENLGPELAESYEEDASGVTFVLREDAVSPAGNTVTSEDVKWTFERIAANGAVGALLLGIANVDFDDPVTVVDERTVKINTTAASSLLLPILDNAALGILDSTEAKKHATKDDPWAGEWLKTNTASFGAYSVADFKPGEEVVLDGNEEHFDGAPAIDTVTVRNVPEAASRAQLLQTGSADIAMGVPPVEWKALEANDKMTTQAMDSPNALQIWFNTTKDPMTNANLRRAVSHAVNRQDIADGLFPGVGTPADGCSAATSPVQGFTLDVPMSGDTAKAQELAADSDLDGPLLMIYNSAANVFSETAARLVQDQLKAAGIEVQLKGFGTQAEYQAAMDKREWDLNLGVQGLFVNHPLYELKMFLTGDSSLNIPAYANEEFTTLVDTALSASGDDAAAATLEACEIAINGDVPLITLMNYPYTLAATTAVNGIRSYPYDRLPFADLS